jgi:hypothetical protein
MRKLPHIGPLIVPTILDTLFANVGHWLSELPRFALLVSLIVVPIWLVNSKWVNDVNPSGHSNYSRHLSLESSPIAIPASKTKPDENQIAGSAAEPTSGSVPNSVDAAPHGPWDD